MSKIFAKPKTKIITSTSSEGLEILVNEFYTNSGLTADKIIDTNYNTFKDTLFVFTITYADFKVQE
jgi:hypothetical protein